MSVGSNSVESHYEEKQMKAEGVTLSIPGAHERNFLEKSFQKQKKQKVFHDNKSGTTCYTRT